MERLVHRLFQALDHAVASIVITDLDGKIEYVNQRFTEVTGYRREDAIGRRPSMLSAGETPPEVYADLWRTIKDGRQWKGELVNRRKDGTTYPDAIAITPLRDKTGAITNFLGVQQDITGQRGIERALRERDELFRQIGENISDVFFIAEADFSRTMFVSAAYERTWGRSVASVYADPRSFIEGIAAEDRARVVERLGALRLGAEPGEIEFRVRRPDGEERVVLGRAVPIRDPAGRVYRMAGIAVDITERRALTRQLEQAQKMEAVGQLAGGVAHDFNNVLTAISGYTELLRLDMAEDDARRADVAEIDNAVRRAAGLTRQLLAFSRRQVLQPTVLDPNDIVRGLEPMLRRLIGEHIDFGTALDPAAGRVRADAGQLEQVLLNLVVNARDAMPRGGRLVISSGRVGVSAETAAATPGLAAGTYAEIAVADNGTGMSAEVRQHMFEPFYTTKAAGKGSGLGLATVYGIVKQSGGYIAVESDVGRGSAFRVMLPAVSD